MTVLDNNDDDDGDVTEQDPMGPSWGQTPLPYPLL